MKLLTYLGAFVLVFACASGAWADKQSPLEIVGATTILVGDAKALFDRGVPFVDVRKDSDWEAGRIPGATHLELKKVLSEEALTEIVGKDEDVVFYCNGSKCMRSSEACTKAVAWGFRKVYYFRDGFPAWEAADLAIE